MTNSDIPVGPSARHPLGLLALQLFNQVVADRGVSIIQRWGPLTGAT
jgi:hypothetical protein